MQTRKRESAKEDAKKKDHFPLDFRLPSGVRASKLDPVCWSSSRLPSRFRAFAFVFLLHSRRTRFSGSTAAN
jgi:hypothetical protein